MKKSKVIFSVVFAVIFLSLFVVPSVVKAADGTKVAVIKVTAGTDALAANTPIVIKPADLPEGVTALNTAVIYDGSTALPTQADNLYGDSAIDEIVFQLPEAIAAGESASFNLYVDEEATDNGQSASTTIDLAQEDHYNETYDAWLPAAYVAGYSNASGNAPAVDEVGEVIWVETDWGIMCLYVSAGWRQGTWKHAYIKNSAHDALMANYDPWTDWRWQWLRFGYESDQGWHNGDYPDEVMIAKVGPVRAVIQTKTGVGYVGATGNLDNLKLLRTYTLYSGFQGLRQNIRLTGSDAAQAATDFTALYNGETLDFVSKWMDFGANTTSTPWSYLPTGNKYDRVYSPGTPNFAGDSNRYNPDEQYLVLDDMEDSYFAMYSSTSNNGYVINFGLNFTWIMDYVVGIDWSDGEIVVKQEYDKFPLTGVERVFIPFGGTTTDVEAKIDGLNDMWTADLSYEATKPAPAPGFEIFVGMLAFVAIAVVYRKRR